MCLICLKKIKQLYLSCSEYSEVMYSVGFVQKMGVRLADGCTEYTLPKRNGYFLRLMLD